MNPAQSICGVCRVPGAYTCSRWDCPPTVVLRAKAQDVSETLTARESTHGNFTCNGKIMQQLKLAMRQHPGWDRLTPAQCEALEMIQHKVGRILCGDPNFKDHWHDIAGYAKLAEERCTK